MVCYHAPCMCCVSGSRACPACRLAALQGMEVYSTVLWHLKREVQAAHLAQQAIGLDRLSPHAWCVMGNCFSLHKVRPGCLM